MKYENIFFSLGSTQPSFELITNATNLLSGDDVNAFLTDLENSLNDLINQQIGDSDLPTVANQNIVVVQQSAITDGNLHFFYTPFVSFFIVLVEFQIYWG